MHIQRLNKSVQCGRISPAWGGGGLWWAVLKCIGSLKHFVFVFVFVFVFLFVFVSTTSMSMAVQCGRIGPEESAGVGRCEPQLRLSWASDAEQTTSIKSNQVYLECGEIPTNRKLVSKLTCCGWVPLCIFKLCERWENYCHGFVTRSCFGGISSWSEKIGNEKRFSGNEAKRVGSEDAPFRSLNPDRRIPVCPPPYSRWTTSFKNHK